MLDVLKQVLWVLFILFAIGVTLYAVSQALLKKRDPIESWAWIGISLFFPPVGAILFLLFGINRVRQKAQKIGGLASYSHSPPQDEQLEDLHQPFPYTGVDYYQDHRNICYHNKLAYQVTGKPLLKGNKIKPFFSGDDAYQDMIRQIDRAKQSIWLMSYIFHGKTITDTFTRSLKAAQDRGVSVCVLLDGIGLIHGWPMNMLKLKKYGIKYAAFLPPTLLPPSILINLRNHRKVLIVDEKYAFAGGMNITDDCLIKSKKNKHPIEDVHFRLEGPIVSQLSDLFIHDWQFVTGLKLSSSSLPYRLSPSTTYARVTPDGPNEDLNHLTTLIASAIQSARTSINIMTPYFLPSRPLILAFMSAAYKGVSIRIFLPQKTDNPIVRWAMHHLVWQLQHPNIEIIELGGAFKHTKLLTVDGVYAMIGSHNLDPRSLRLNFELGIEVYDQKLANSLDRHMEKQFTTNPSISIRHHLKPSLLKRVRNALCWLFTPYL